VNFPKNRANASALATWRAMRTGSVSTPCSQVEGVGRAHAGAEVTQALGRARMMNAAGPNSSAKAMP